MRILALSPNFPYPPNAGSKARIYNILSRLGQANEIVLACLSHEHIDSDRLKGLQGFCHDVYVEQGPKRVLLNKLKWLLHTDPFHVRMFWSDALCSKVSILLAQQHFDAIYCNLLYMAQCLDAHDAQTTVRVVDQQNADYVMWQFLRDKDPRLAIRLMARLNYIKTRCYEDKHYSKFDLCFSVSDEDAAATAQIAPDRLRICVAPNGVDIRYFVPTPNEPVDPDSLLFFGTMTTRMNVDAVVYFAREILPPVRAVLPNARFTIVGRNPTRRVQQLNRLPGVVVTGEVPDIRPYLSRCSLVVAPVRLGGGTKLKVLEAMAMGKAVVATSHACRGLSVNEGEDIVLADTVSAFADKVIWMLRDREARQRIGASARGNVERNYNWDTIVANIMSEMEEMLHSKRAARRSSTEGL